MSILRIRFSNDSKQILTVSRDRSWCIFEHVDHHEWKLKSQGQKAHGRVIWDCAWIPVRNNESDGAFVTASRDKTVKVWNKVGPSDAWTCLTTMPCPEACTSISVTLRDR